MSEPLVIWGAGAIGGTIGAHLARAGHEVLLVDHVAEHVLACRTGGLAIEGPVAEFRVVVPAVTPAELTGTYRRIILAVKAQATRGAVAMLAPHLAADGFVLSAQNGLNEIEIAEALGASRTMGCFVNFGADWLAPGHILYGNRSALVIGELDGAMTPRAREMLALLRDFEPEAELTGDIWAYLWGKLAYGAMLFATALNNDSMHANFADPARAPVWRALAREVVMAASAEGVRPRGFGGFDPLAFAHDAPSEAGDAAIRWIEGFTAVGAKTHSGVWRDLAVRKRKTEGETQIGIIARLAARRGVATPAIDALLRLIADVEEGRREQGAATFAELARAV
jgi:2-dehydropantoate 2-reductase